MHKMARFCGVAIGFEQFAKKLDSNQPLLLDMVLRDA